MIENNTAMGVTTALSRFAMPASAMLAGMRPNNPPASRPAQ